MINYLPTDCLLHWAMNRLSNNPFFWKLTKLEKHNDGLWSSKTLDLNFYSALTDSVFGQVTLPLGLAGLQD